MAALYEKYRPGDLDGVVGQDSAVAQIKEIMEAGTASGRAWWFTGASGTGKTTLSRIIAHFVADDIREFNARKLNTEMLEQLLDAYRCKSLFGNGGKCFIINEAHTLPKRIVEELLTALEPENGLPEHITWIFTTTKDGKDNLFEEKLDAAPLLSRCTEIELDNGPDTMTAFAQRARDIAIKEGIDGLPMHVYLFAAQEAKGNMRRLLQQVESGRLVQDAEKQLSTLFSS